MILRIIVNVAGDVLFLDTADAMFESVISGWLFDRLSQGTEEGEDPVAVLSKFEPFKVVKDSFDLAKLKPLIATYLGTLPSTSTPSPYFAYR